MPNLDDVTLPTTTAGFDLDAWLDGAVLPEKIATVFGRGDLAAEYDSLDDQLNDARAARIADGGMMNDPTAGDIHRLTARMDEIRAELVASKLEIRCRAVPRETSAEIDIASESIPEGVERQRFVAEHYVAASAVSPRMTVEQARRLHQRIGEGQFAQVFDAAFTASNEKRISVPFSLAHSVSRATQVT